MFQAPSAQTPQQGDGFVCDVCGQKYTRLDHLTRHLRSHTQERPFQCAECGKAFARTDLLKRHALGHEKEGPANKKQKLVTQPTRHRTAQACLACAKSKLRCDGAEPCSRCAKKTVDCVYRAPNTSDDLDTRRNSMEIGDDQQKLQQLHSPYPRNENGSDQINHIGTQSVNIAQTPQWTTFPQLPTPVTFEDPPLQDQPSVEASASNIDFDDTYLADFLKDIMHPVDSLNSSEHHDVNFAPRDFLDFNFATSFEYLDGYDIPLQTSTRQSLEQVQVGDGEVQTQVGQIAANASRSGYATPVGKNGLGMSAQAFKESLWLWTPQQGDNITAHQGNLSLPAEAFITAEQEGLGPPPFPSLGQTARDQVLAAVLDHCDRAVTTVVVSSFPSAELLTVLIHKWMNYHRNQVDTYFHFAGFDPNSESPDMLICMISAGAALSKSPRVRKLGYAFQEAARAANSSTFEGDNRNIRKLRPMQSLAVVLDIGLWSGDRRKVEIAESFSNCLVTMFRRGNFFARSDNSGHMPIANDSPSVLSSKWRAWIEAESMRRIAAHLLIQDSQTSACLLIPPLVSFAEMLCSLPSVRSIWMAQTSKDWADLMISFSDTSSSGQATSIRSCLHDMSSVSAARRHIDIELSILALSNAFWGLAWQHRQIEAVAKHSFDEVQHGSFMTNTIRQTAVQKLQQFRLLSSEVYEARPEATLTTERVLMNLHVSIEDVQMLAGKGGEQEARRTFSTLRQWSRSSDSRQAVWHAGQIIRAACDYPPGTLRDASSIAVYHAGLVLWAYSILTNADKTARQSQNRTDPEIVVNNDNTTYLERFVMLSRGIPVLKLNETHSRTKQSLSIPISDARRVMKAIVGLLQNNNGTAGEECPPLVENLSKLMRSLGNAARSILGVEFA